MLKTSKKLVLISATSLSKTEAGMEDTLLLLKWVSYIHYPLRFQKDFADVRVLIDFNSKVNAMASAYILKLGLRAYHINVRTQKIDSFIFQMYRMILASF